MKIRAINVVELILFILFTGSLLFNTAHVLLLKWITVISCMLLGCLYWPLGFYTLKSPGVNIAYTIGASLLFCESVVLTTFRVMKWPMPVIVSKVAIGLYFVTFLAILGRYLIARRKAQPLTFDKWLIARFIAYFLFMIYVVFA